MLVQTFLVALQIRTPFAGGLVQVVVAEMRGDGAGTRRGGQQARKAATPV